MDGRGIIALLAGALGVSAVLTGVVRRYALDRAILDMPNERSSHSVPTPRGGGIAIVGVVLALSALVAWRFPDLRHICIALAGGGALVAAVGWLDDRKGVSPRIRALVHLLAAVWAVAWVGGVSRLTMGPWQIELGLVGSVLAVVGVVWAINLYNFMDGIDGIAGGEAVVAGCFGAAMLWMASDTGLAALSAAIAGASAGFLIWNWSPARIFMGDVGSGSLGFFFATLAIASEVRVGVPLLAWVVLLGVFVFDTTATLVRRVGRGEKWYSAHRSHAYQRATQQGFSHRQVAAGALVLTGLLGFIGGGMWLYPSLTLVLFVFGTGFVGATYLWVERIRPM